MMLREELRRRLLEEHGIYVKEACDKCGQLLGAVRYTRKDDPGVWCSRECRDGADAHVPGSRQHCKAKLPTGKRRGTVFCDEACKQAAHRAKPVLQKSRTGKLSVTKTSIYAGFSSEKGRDGAAGHPATFGGPTREIAQGLDSARTT